MYTIVGLELGLQWKNTFKDQNFHLLNEGKSKQETKTKKKQLWHFLLRFTLVKEKTSIYFYGTKS